MPSCIEQISKNLLCTEKGDTSVVIISVLSNKNTHTSYLWVLLAEIGSQLTS
jgi:hypothetical protein